MTTLSKEDVVRMAETVFSENWVRMNAQYLSEFATLARAGLVAENERLKAELSKHEAVPQYKEARRAEVAVLHDQLTATRTALAAAEAREIAAINCIDELIGLLVRPFCDSASAKRAAALINTPRDDSALREMIAEVYEKCAKVCEAMNYINTQPHHCADAIRALAEKAKGE